MRKTVEYYVLAAFALGALTAAKTEKDQVMEAHGKMSADMKKDPQRYQRECDQGKAQSCTREGIFYAFGTWGHTRDYAKAKPLFEKACAVGDQDGCKELAALYQYGRGVPQNQAKALEIYTATCAAKNATSCYYAAEMHRYGQGTAKNLKQAAALYEKACATGYKSACGKKL